MNTISLHVLIVEDNPGQQELLKAQLDTIPNISVLNCVSNAKDYIDEVTVNKQLNAVILDEELLGNMNGLEAYGLLKIRGSHLPTIVMTGNVPYASHTSDLGIIDTIEKPFTIERLTMGLNKIRQHIHYQQYLNSGGIFVPVISQKIIQLMPNEILFIESINRTLFVHTDNESYETKISIKLYEEYLSGSNFVLTHRSCLVNLNKVEQIVDEKIYFNGAAKTAILAEEKAVDFKQIWNVFKNLKV